MKPLTAASLFALALAAAPAAAGAPVRLRHPPDLAEDVAAYPRLVGGSAAVAKINRALDAADATTRRGARQCLRDAPDGEWLQGVDTPLLGAHFVAFMAHGSFSCGGAHPDFIAAAMVFDLATGARVDWNALLPARLRAAPGPGAATLGRDRIASPGLTALFRDQAASDIADADCQEAFAHEPLTFLAWPDSKARGLALAAANLPHAVAGVCGEAVIVPVAALKRLGFDAALVRDIETGGP
jgi:hypothetical protein